MKNIDDMFTASHVSQSLQVRDEVTAVRASKRSDGGFTFEANVPTDTPTADFEAYLESFKSGYGADIQKTEKGATTMYTLRIGSALIDNL
jgi:hypothetical protein